MRQKPHTAARTPPLPRGPLQGIERKGDRVAFATHFHKGRRGLRKLVFDAPPPFMKITTLRVVISFSFNSLR